MSVPLAPGIIRLTLFSTLSFASLISGMDPDHVGPVTTSVSDLPADSQLSGSFSTEETATKVLEAFSSRATAHAHCVHGTCNCTVDPFQRAGRPDCISRWAVPSNHCHYAGYYVGGSLPWRGEGPCTFHEGTWGWDYLGILFSKRVALNWGRGRRFQGGSGTYRTDGPKLFHD